MSKVLPLLRHETISRLRLILPVLILATIAGFTSSCRGGSMSGTSMPRFSGNTSVTVLLSSTANDQLSEFDLVLQGIALTSQSGKTVSLLSAMHGAEFMDVNGGAKPFFTVSIPQDIYTAATVTVGSAQFTCVTLTPLNSAGAGGLDTSTYAYGQTPTANVTVTLPSPITITGDSMGLSLNLLVSQSATFTSCYDSGIAPYSITPTFSVSPLNFLSQPTNPQNGKVSAINGEVTALGTVGNSFTLTLPQSAFSCPCPGVNTLSITTDNNTVYNGINSSSALAMGTFVDMDGAIQADGSLRATRISVHDPAAFNVMFGPLLFVAAEVPEFYSLGRQAQGQDYSVQGQSLGIYSFSPSTTFQISDQLDNVANLPFAASFNSVNMVPGQNVATYSQAITDFSGGQYTQATTMTLMPQTINGTVMASSTSDGFSIYTVSLATYDLLPNLAIQPGQATLLTNPSQVEVYVDSNAQLLNMQPLAAGNTLRFYGLMFNDNGTLRMDCAQVNDGVAETPQSSNAKNYLEHGEARTTRHEFLGLPQITTKVTTHQTQP